MFPATIFPFQTLLSLPRFCFVLCFCFLFSSACCFLFSSACCASLLQPFSHSGLHILALVHMLWCTCSLPLSPCLALSLASAISRSRTHFLVLFLSLSFSLKLEIKESPGSEEKIKHTEIGIRTRLFASVHDEMNRKISDHVCLNEVL